MPAPPPRGAPSSATRAGGRLVARGSAENPAGRFERIRSEELDEAPGPADEAGDGEAPPVPTVYLRDPSRSLLARNQSPDIGFDTSLNPYRGCEHGCVYCYARPTHEYLGFSAGLDFETRILVKPDAPKLLRDALAGPGWRPQVVALSGVTDPYQPAERRLRITRGCLEVFAEFRNPVAIVTKSALVARDVDLLAELASVDAAAVNLSITTLDDALRRRIEPRAASPGARLDAIERLTRAGVPTGVMVAPVIPGLNDAEIPAIVAAAAAAGARSAAWIMLRLPHGVAQLFESWLERHLPERRAKVMNRLRSLRAGRVNDPRFHSRMRGSGAFAQQVEDLFTLACRRAGIGAGSPELSTAAFRRPGDAQLPLL